MSKDIDWTRSKKIKTKAKASDKISVPIKNLGEFGRATSLEKNKASNKSSARVNDLGEFSEAKSLEKKKANNKIRHSYLKIKFKIMELVYWNQDQNKVLHQSESNYVVVQLH